MTWGKIFSEAQHRRISRALKAVPQGARGSGNRLGGVHRDRIAAGYTHPADIRDIADVEKLCRKAARQYEDGSFAYTYKQIAKWWNAANPEKKLTTLGVRSVIDRFAPGLIGHRSMKNPILRQKVERAQRKQSEESNQKRRETLAAGRAQRREQLERLKAELGPMPEIPPNRTAPDGHAAKRARLLLEAVDQVPLENAQSPDQHQPIEPTVTENLRREGPAVGENRNGDGSDVPGAGLSN